MKAAYYEAVGPAREVLSLADLPLPEPAAGEVRVRVMWSGVNPSDVKSRAGRPGVPMPFARVIPHSDGSGVIDAVGEGVAASRVGERVWLWNAAWGRPHGTACEAVCLPQQQAVRLPDGVSGEAGACLGIPALTALHAVLMDGGVAGKTVLVAGGAGAVGHYAVQMASRLGAACVISTVSGDEKARIAREAGAHAVLNYRTDALTKRVTEITQGRGVDRIIELDLAANAGVDIQLLRDGGEVVVYGSGASPMALPFLPLIAKNVQLKFFMVYHLSAGDRERASTVLTRLLEQGALRHQVAQRLPLERISEAHELVESGRVVGNVVLRVGAE